ncbi:predicted protein [Nematostella vectensis]|uniref:PDZ domain-containing protein n=1 Tax=Nematostella vectensis TaxID=45351 RepID=A7SHZ9_NEMVE|nr:predicted protein [Nematostella vectensis]|eukprot:XP_001628724.1 predicted protein [Nematostella vectensis]
MAGPVSSGYLYMQVAKGELQKVRVKLSREALTIQKEGGPYASPNAQLATGSPIRNGSPGLDSKPGTLSKERNVRITRRKIGGLGMSIRGGRESNLPVAISRIYKDQAAAATNNLYEGDIILEVNGHDLRHATHDEAVAALREGGSEVEIVVTHGSTANGIVRSIEEANEDSHEHSRLILHMCWVWERLKSTNHWNIWKRKFLTIKGPLLQLFEMPPVVTRDWMQSEVVTRDWMQSEVVTRDWMQSEVVTRDWMQSDVTHNLMEIVFHVCTVNQLVVSCHPPAGWYRVSLTFTPKKSYLP